jgi:nitrite reductase/ring-hydroxylating ferredoxin subunit
LRAARAWNALLMVLLEVLSRVYGEGREAESYQAREQINTEPIQQLALETYERSLGIARAIEYREVQVGSADELRQSGRKIVEVEGLSIGVFYHDGAWHALQNSCLHRGGPVCNGPLEDGVITCPWHGYQYRLETGELLIDPSVKLPSYPVEARDGQVYLNVPVLIRDAVDISLDDLFAKADAKAAAQAKLAPNEFRVADLPAGEIALVSVDGEDVAVYNVDGAFYATQDICPHADGPLSEGALDGSMVICPWHASCFDVVTGAVLKGPATEPLRVYRVVVDGDVGRVE